MTPGDMSGTGGTSDLAALAAALRAEVDGEIRFDAGSRGAYATDGSNYRQVPLGVVAPRTVEDGARAVSACARSGAPVLSRGGGTSLAGQCANTAVVIDRSKYCTGLITVDPERRTCVVEPGIVLDDLNTQLARYQLRFGPKPSTHSHSALGGMIGNNSCGASAQTCGKTVDDVRRLEILTYDGQHAWVGPTPPAERARIIAAGGRLADLCTGLDRIVTDHLADIRHGYPKIPRRVSGYNLDLVPVPPYQSLLVLGYDDICAAADDVPRLLEHSSPTQLEAPDGRMAQLMREEGAYLDPLDVLPEGDSWLMAQYSGHSQEDVDGRRTPCCAPSAATRTAPPSPSPTTPGASRRCSGPARPDSAHRQ